MTASNQTLTAAEAHHARRWLVLLVVALAQLMVVLDATVVNIALPSAQRALGFANSDRQWIITAYALSFGSLLLLGGRVGDLFGRKWTFIGGMIGFAVASAVGGLASSFAVLVTARTLQGVFGAMLAPAALATLSNTFREGPERARAFGIYGAVAGGGGAFGLLLGGALTEYASWRWCFFVNLFFAAVGVFGALALIRNDADPERPQLDLAGSLFAGAGLFGIVYGFSHAQTTAWSNGVTIVSLAAGVALVAIFVLVESRVASPLLPLRVLKDRNRSAAYTSMALAAISVFGVFLFLTYYLQLIKGFSPLKTGVAFLPMIIFVVIGSTVAQMKLLPIVGARVLVALGMVLGAVGMFLLSEITPGASYATHVLPILPVIGIGMGMIFAPSFNLATAGVAPTDSGVASALVNTMQQVGGSLGTSLLSTIALSATATYLVAHKVGRASVLAADAAVHGYTIAFTVSGAIFVFGAVVSFFLIQPHLREIDDDFDEVPELGEPALVE